MVQKQTWEEFPIYRNELRNIIAALHLTSVSCAQHPDDAYVDGFRAALEAVAVAAGIMDTADGSAMPKHESSKWVATNQKNPRNIQVRER